jgi:hypothetical protein
MQGIEPRSLVTIPTELSQLRLWFTECKPVNDVVLGTAHTFQLWFVVHVDTDQRRRYSTPATDETASVCISENGDPPGHRYVIMHGRGADPKIPSALWSCDMPALVSTR